MKIAVISDLHIGDSTGADDFKIQDDMCIKHIQQLVRMYDKVIINGDLFECWQSKSWDAQVKQFSRIRKAHPALVEYLIDEVTNGRVIYINGNHDAVVRTHQLIPNVVKNYIVETTCGDKKVKLLFEHGHQADAANSKVSWFGQFIAWSLGFLERAGLYDIDTDLGRLEKLIPGRSTGEFDIFYKYAREKLNSEYDLVCLGHTHDRMYTCGTTDRMTTGYYVNSGNSMTKFTVTDIHIQDDGIQVFSWLIEKSETIGTI